MELPPDDLLIRCAHAHTNHSTQTHTHTNHGQKHHTDRAHRNNTLMAIDTGSQTLWTPTERLEQKQMKTHTRNGQAPMETKSTQ